MNANINSALPSVPPGSKTESGESGSIGDSALIDPVDWEARYQAGDTPWDKGYAAPPLIEFLLRHPVRGTVLVPGSGPGHDVRALVAKGTTVLGLDLSATAVERARSFSPIGDETYEQGDLFQFPESWKGRFDWIIEHTCFCAIPPALRDRYVRSIAALLKPGGFYFAIFYLNPDVSEGPPYGVERAEIARRFDPSFELLEEWIPLSCFEGREGREICQLRKLL